MKTIYLSTVFSITLLFSVFCVNSAAFSTGNSGADFLAEIGERHLANGETEMAIHEFQKALLLSPSHPVATARLNEMGLGKTGATTDRSHRQEVARLGEIIKQQNDKIKYLKKLKTRKQKQPKMKVVKKTVRPENTDHRRITVLQNKIHDLQKEQLDHINNVASYYKKNIDKPASHHSDQEMMEARYYKAVETALHNADTALRAQAQNDRLKKFVSVQYAHQDKLIHVLEDYLHLREEQIRQMGNDVTLAKIEEAKQELQLFIEQTEALGINQEHKARLDLLNQKIEELGLIKQN